MLTTTHYFRVGGFVFSVSLPAGSDVRALLPSFVPFMVDGNDRGGLLFSFTLAPPGAEPGGSRSRLLEETDNDMGLLRLYSSPSGYIVDVTRGAFTHCMSASPDFSSVEASLVWSDANVGGVLSSMLRIAYAQSVLGHDAVSVHAAAVYYDGKAYLFMGKSGTGKSTHASLWMKHVPGSRLLNDDNPVLRLVDGKACAYGTPWSGKTHCYKQLSFPVGGIVRLAQSPVNRFSLKDGVDAFIVLYPGCSVISEDVNLRNRLYDTLSRLAESAVIGTLECRPDAEAVGVCYNALHNTEVNI